MSVPVIKPKLLVNGQFVGYVEDVSYSRPAVRLPDANGFEQYAPGSEVTMDVTLMSSVKVQDKYRLLDSGEQLYLTDEWYSVVEMKWYPISMFRQDLDGQFSDGDLYRRKALVLV